MAFVSAYFALGGRFLLLLALLVGAWACGSRSDDPQPPALTGLSFSLLDRAGCPNEGGVSAARYELGFSYNGPRGFDPDSLVLLIVARGGGGELVDSVRFVNSTKYLGEDSGFYPYTRDGDRFSMQFCLWHNHHASLELAGIFLRPDGTPVVENRLFFGSGDAPEVSGFRLQAPNPREPFQVTDLRHFIFTVNDVEAPDGGDNYTSLLADVSFTGEEPEFLTGLTYIELTGYTFDGTTDAFGQEGRRIGYFSDGTPPKVLGIPEVGTMYRQDGRAAFRMYYPVRFGGSDFNRYALHARVVCTSLLPASSLRRLRDVAYFGAPTTDVYSRNSEIVSVKVARPDGAN